MRIAITKRRVLSLLALTLGSISVAAQDAPGPELKMKCLSIPPLAAVTTPADKQAEAAFCQADMSSSSTAICPKTWSTSPGALIYDLTTTSWEGRADDFEQQICQVGGRARDQAHSELAIFKNSMNGRETSGTFAPSSLLYYHFSRLLETRVRVPVAVMAEFSIPEYRQRVVEPGLQYSDSEHLKMLHAGWLELDQALSDPQGYTHRSEMISADHTRLWGVLLLVSGYRYGPELNGTRASGWGDGQNRDFQKTAPFLALRTDLPLAEAIASGLKQAREDAAMDEALVRHITPQQIAWWMHELTEIVVLDTILAQQDRIGNIDYLWRWLWTEDGELQQHPSQPNTPGAVKVRVSVLNDNDAGVRSSYANYASRTAMLANWHHMDPGFYKRVVMLATDFANAGPLATAVRENYRLSEHEASNIIKRGISVGALLKQQCQSGSLRFDLSASSILDPATAKKEPETC